MNESSEARAMTAASECWLDRLRMTFTLSDAPVARLQVCLLVVGVFARNGLSNSAEAVDTASRGRLAALLRRGDLENRIGASVIFYDLPGVAARRVLVVCLGDRKSFDESAFFKALIGAGQALNALNVRDVAFTLAELQVCDHPLEWRIMHSVRILADSAYRFNAAGNHRECEDRGVRNIALLPSSCPTLQMELAVRGGAATAAGMALARDLGNLPGNIRTPACLAETARVLAEEHGFELEIVEREAMAKLTMLPGFSPARARDDPCRFVVLRCRRGGDRRPIVLVGNGLTFDTDGKQRICGAATVLATMEVVGLLRLPLNVVGIVSAATTARAASTTRPGDVVVSMSGHTVEILEADTEGRLILGDALTLADRYEPECIIDIATMTDACVKALGTHTSGLFANDDALAEELFECGLRTGDRAWRLPLWPEYQELLNSTVADLRNINGGNAAAITAACFLSRFAGRHRWAHLDISGTANGGEGAGGCTGRPVPLLSEFLLQRAAARRT
ncbi:MAG TPA: leucyl aminopeptidase [Steroidobacteraceae bacterium]